MRSENFFENPFKKWRSNSIIFEMYFTMMESIKRFKGEVGVQLILWFAHFNLELFGYINYYNFTFKELTYLFFLGLPAKALFIYSTIYWSVPRFFFKKKYLTFAFVTLLILLISAMMYMAGAHYLFNQYYRIELFNSTPYFDIGSFVRSFEFILTVGSVFIAFSLVRISFLQHKMNHELRTANISAELKNLKEQIKPHFLFNTLNNLYGLTRKDPEKASEVVMRLSQIMSYILYSVNEQKVSIRDEVDFLQDYLELEKIRYDRNIEITFQKRIEFEHFQIPPLILQPFVENAFKHGLSKLRKDAWLQINLKVDQHELSFKVTNSKPDLLSNRSLPSIGIENVRKRLDIIYPDSYRLMVMDEGQSFLVNLTIVNTTLKATSEKLYENQVPSY